MYGLKQQPKDNRLIKGAGTGTSDSIKKDVPAGTYIMPVDSTDRLGAKNLKNMGSPTPVNVSNGEFELSPDQVHSVGVQTLDAMKDQTHTPVNQPQLGFKPGQNKPELFFANGGVVPSTYPSADDIRRAQQNRASGAQMRDVSGITRDVNRPLPSTNVNTSVSSPATTSTPSANPVNPAPAQGGGFGAGARSLLNNSRLVKGVGYLGAASSLFANAATPSEDYRERFGFGEQSPEDLGTAKGLAKDFGVRALGYASDLGNAFTFGQAGRMYRDKQRIASEAKEAQPEFNTKQNNLSNTEVGNPFGNIKTPTSTVKQSQPEVQTSSNPVQSSNPYAIQQKGNSFSYADAGAAAQARANGIPELQSTGVQTGRGVTGIKNFMANTPEMGPTEQQIQNAIAQREM
ncbi:MAG: hypothetical protein RSB25_09220, partial [Acinetobacter sp.]